MTLNYLYLDLKIVHSSPLFLSVWTGYEGQEAPAFEKRSWEAAVHSSAAF